MVERFIRVNLRTSSTSGSWRGSRRSSIYRSERCRGWGLEFRVIWEIEIEADSPEEAARAARAAQLKPDLSATLFNVWEHARWTMHRIDVEQPVDCLDHDELAAVVDCLRLLQCAPGTKTGVKVLISVMLIFLDREQRMSRSEGPRLSRQRAPKKVIPVQQGDSN